MDPPCFYLNAAYLSKLQEIFSSTTSLSAVIEQCCEDKDMDDTLDLILRLPKKKDCVLSSTFTQASIAMNDILVDVQDFARFEESETAMKQVVENLGTLKCVLEALGFRDAVFAVDFLLNKVGAHAHVCFLRDGPEQSEPGSAEYDTKLKALKVFLRKLEEKEHQNVLFTVSGDILRDTRAVVEQAEELEDITFNDFESLNTRGFDRKIHGMLCKICDMIYSKLLSTLPTDGVTSSTPTIVSPTLDRRLPAPSNPPSGNGRKSKKRKMTKEQDEAIYDYVYDKRIKEGLRNPTWGVVEYRWTRDLKNKDEYHKKLFEDFSSGNIKDRARNMFRQLHGSSDIGEPMRNVPKADPKNAK